MTQASNAASAARELISFRIGEQAFCVDIMAVREIRGWTPATAVPRTASYMKGVINLRGAVLPIIDLGARLGLKTTEPTARHVIMVVAVGERTIGLLVDAVSDIIEMTDDAIQPTPDIGSDRARGFVKGILAIDGRMVSLIDLNWILPEPESEAA